MIFGSANQLFFPHITVWGSCFSLGSRRGSRLLRPPSLTSQSHHSHITIHHSFTHHSFTHHFFSHLTSHILTSHTSLITSSLLKPHPSQLHFSHLTYHITCLSHTSLGTAGPRLPLAWRAQYTYHLTTHHSSTSHTSLITSHISLPNYHISLNTSHLRLSPLVSSITTSLLTSHSSQRLALAWQAQYTEPPSGAVARVGAAGPRLPFAWQTQYTEPPGGAAARVGAAGRTVRSRSERNSLAENKGRTENKIKWQEIRIRVLFSLNYGSMSKSTASMRR